MQDDGELAGNSNSGTGHTVPLGHVHAPRSEARLFLAAHEQRMGRFIERGAGKLVATSADLALNVGLAGLIVRIPMIPDSDSETKPDAYSDRYRTRFRGEAGRLRAPLGRF